MTYLGFGMTGAGPGAGQPVVKPLVRGHAHFLYVLARFSRLRDRGRNAISRLIFCSHRCSHQNGIPWTQWTSLEYVESENRSPLNSITARFVNSGPPVRIRPSALISEYDSATRAHM